jgi:hypothetical protein
MSSFSASFWSQVVRIPLVGGTEGCSSTKAKRRRIAASTSAMERSVVFIVPMRKMLGGMMKSESEEYSRLIW